MLYYLLLGIADGHELGRVFTNADKNCFEDFSISFLSPVMTFMERPIKSLNIRDEVGYIEIQIRKMLQVPAHKSTRLWVKMLHQNTSIFGKLHQNTSNIKFVFLWYTNCHNACNYQFITIFSTFLLIYQRFSQIFLIAKRTIIII